MRLIGASWTPRYATIRHLISGRDPAGDAQHDFQAAGGPSHVDMQIKSEICLNELK